MTIVANSARDRSAAHARRLVASIAAGGLLIAGALRFLAAGVVPAVRELNGDFGLVFPSPYFGRFRPDFPMDHVWNELARMHIAGDRWTYGPMVHFITLPLLLVPRWSMVPAVWASVNLVAVGASLLLAIRLSGVTNQLTRTALVALSGAWLLFQPLVTCFRQGNIELIEMAIMLAAVVALPRFQGRAGVLMGVATMLKFLPIGFLGWFLLRRKWRAVSAGLVTIALIAVATSLTLGWSNSALVRAHYWQDDVPQLGLNTLSVTSLFLHRTSLPDYSEPDLLNMWWMPSSHQRTAAVAGEIASVALVAAYGGLLFVRRSRPVSPFEIGVLFMAMFLVVPWNHDYYYVFSLAPLTVVALRSVVRRAWGMLSIVSAAYLLMSPPIPFTLVDRFHWLRVPFAYVFNYYDIPLIGALVLWLIVTWELLKAPAEAVHDDVPLARVASRMSDAR